MRHFLLLFLSALMLSCSTDDTPSIWNFNIYNDNKLTSNESVLKTVSPIYNYCSSQEEVKFFLSLQFESNIPLEEITFYVANEEFSKVNLSNKPKEYTHIFNYNNVMPLVDENFRFTFKIKTLNTNGDLTENNYLIEDCNCIPLEFFTENLNTVNNDINSTVYSIDNNKSYNSEEVDDTPSISKEVDFSFNKKTDDSIEINSINNLFPDRTWPYKRRTVFVKDIENNLDISTIGIPINLLKCYFQEENALENIVIQENDIIVYRTENERYGLIKINEINVSENSVDYSIQK